MAMFSRDFLGQVVAFACVGVVATMVHYSAALVLVDLADVEIMFANLLGYASAVCVSLFGHGVFTYKRKVNRAIAVRFIIVSLSALAVSEGVLWFLEYKMFVDHRIALGVVVMIIPIVSFFFNKFWVYT